MKTIQVTKPWRYAHHGHTVQEFVPGESYKVSDECAEAAVRRGVAKATGPSQNKMTPAPKNKQAGAE